jgi:hypothetical protein
VCCLDNTRLAQRMLFGRKERQKQTRLEAVADGVKERFGSAAPAVGQRPAMPRVAQIEPLHYCPPRGTRVRE